MLQEQLNLGIAIDKIMVEFVFNALKQSGHNQKELAEALGLKNAQTVTNWKKYMINPDDENANAIPHKYWFAICKFFDVELVDILNSATNSDKLTSAEIKLIKEIREKNIFEYIKDVVKRTSQQ